MYYLGMAAGYVKVQRHASAAKRKTLTLKKQNKNEKTNKPLRPDDQISPYNELNDGYKGEAHVHACDSKEAASERKTEITPRD